jgi:tRNA (mo5U34)-methyltransferase
MTEPRWRTIARKLAWAIRGRPALLDSAPRLRRREQAALIAKMKALGPWFHNMNLGKGLWTHPENEGAGPDYPAWRWWLIKPMLPDVHGKHCLDIGCSSGFFSLKLKELGASTVTGVDQGEQQRAIEQARFASSIVQLDVDFRPLSVYDVPQLDRRFDLVLFLGVFYHLRHPMLALEAIRKVCRGTLLLQTITTPNRIGTYETPPRPLHVNGSLRSAELNKSEFPILRFVEGSLDGDDSCWFVPSAEAVLAMLRASGFKPEQMILPTGHEIIVRCSVMG